MSRERMCGREVAHTVRPCIEHLQALWCAPKGVMRSGAVGSLLLPMRSCFARMLFAPDSVSFAIGPADTVLQTAAAWEAMTPA
jgi:hypothetical protein